MPSYHVHSLLTYEISIDELPFANVLGQAFELSIDRSRCVWVFPDDRFCVYEPADEIWCRPLHIGHQQQVVERVVFPNAIVTHLFPVVVHRTPFPRTDCRLMFAATHAEMTVSEQTAGRTLDKGTQSVSVDICEDIKVDHLEPFPMHGANQQWTSSRTAVLNGVNVLLNGVPIKSWLIQHSTNQESGS